MTLVHEGGGLCEAKGAQGAKKKGGGLSGKIGKSSALTSHDPFRSLGSGRRHAALVEK